LPATASFRRFHAALEGQLGSEGRTRRMAGLANALRGHSCEKRYCPGRLQKPSSFQGCYLLSHRHSEIISRWLSTNSTITRRVKQGLAFGTNRNLKLCR
jgi:hypothetical protein